MGPPRPEQEAPGQEESSEVGEGGAAAERLGSRVKHRVLVVDQRVELGRIPVLRALRDHHARVIRPGPVDQRRVARPHHGPRPLEHARLRRGRCRHGGCGHRR